MKESVKKIIRSSKKVNCYRKRQKEGAANKKYKLCLKEMKFK